MRTMTRDAERACRLLAESQHGHFTRAQAQEMGLSKYVLQRLVRDCVIAGVYLDVYRFTGYETTWHGRLTAACLWGGAGAFASHRSAAALWQLDGIDRGSPEISTYSSKRTPGVLTHRLRRDDRPRIRLVEGIPVPFVERTLLDLCAVVAIGNSGNALDDALRRRLTTLDRLWLELEKAGRGRNGAQALRRLLEVRDDRDAAAASKFETKMLKVLRRIRGYDLRAQHPVADGPRVYYLDFAFPPHKLAIECQSVKWHLGVERLQKDLARDRRLTLLG